MKRQRALGVTVTWVREASEIAFTYALHCKEGMDKTYVRSNKAGLKGLHPMHIPDELRRNPYQAGTDRFKRKLNSQNKSPMAEIWKKIMMLEK